MNKIITIFNKKGNVIVTYQCDDYEYFDDKRRLKIFKLVLNPKYDSGNIYSQEYIRVLMSVHEKIHSFTIKLDHQAD